MVTRCAVLSRHGYDALYGLPHQVSQQLAAQIFDLVVLCSTLGEADRTDLSRCIPPGRLTLQLEGFVFPEELLSEVAKALTSREALKV